MLLRQAGNEVVMAHDGQTCLERAADFRPEAVLLDIGMPKMNGYDVARRIRERPWGTRAVLIALTGWGQEEDLRRSREAGFDHHLTKPPDREVLERLISGCRDSQ